MTDEIKVTEEVKCNCKEKAIAKLKEFLFIAGAVFVGGTLSILVAANLLKPHHPMGPMGPRPGIHRQLPPPMMHRDFDRGMMRDRRGDCPCRKYKKHHRGEFKGRKGDFKGHRGPHNWDKKPPIKPQEKVKETK
ncbi:hypothetical protein J6A64_07605 [bacterium]|nr:hypothetical protein [bacterium]